MKLLLRLFYRNKPVPDVNIVDSTFGEAVNRIADALSRADIEDGNPLKGQGPRVT